MAQPQPLPDDLNKLLKNPPPPAAPKEEPKSEYTVLAPEDEAYLNKLVSEIRKGKRAIVIMEDSDDKLKYMFSNSTRAESVSMMGKVIEATGRKIQNGEA